MSRNYLALVLVVALAMATIANAQPGPRRDVIYGSPNPSGTTIIKRPIPREPGTNCPQNYPIEVIADGEHLCGALPIDLSGTSNVRLEGRK